MIRTINPDGTKSDFNRKDLSNGQPRPQNQTSNLLQRQKDSMDSTLASVAQCKNITQVRKCLEHGRQTYPTK